MQSLELNRIIKGHKDIAKIYYFNTDIPSTGRRGIDKVGHSLNERLIKVRKGDDQGISKGLAQLWQAIIKEYKINNNEYLVPRGIDRHLAIASTMPKLLSQNYNKEKLKPFCSVDEMKCPQVQMCDLIETCDQGKICKKLKSYRHRKREEAPYKADYFRSRAVLELVISIAKAKGLLIMSNLKSDRCGHYLEKYYAQLSLDKKFTESCQLGDTIETKKCSLPDIIELLHFRTVEYGREIYIHKSEVTKNSVLHKRNQILQPGKFNMWLNDLEEFFCKPNELFNKVLSKNEYKVLKKHLRTIYRGEEVELTYRKNNPHEKIFCDPVPIRTYTALKWHTQDILKEDWDQLYVVAETGEWLMNEVISFLIKERLEKEKSMYILLADETKARVNISQRENILKHHRIVQMRLPWWIHNKHLTICFKNNGTDNAIYFNRRMKTNYIEAVRLGGYDCEAVSNIFFAYWAKASKLCAENNEKGINPCEVSESDVGNEMELIQNGFYLKRDCNKV